MTHSPSLYDLTFVEPSAALVGAQGWTAPQAQAKAHELIQLLFDTQSRGEDVVRAVDVATRTSLGPVALDSMRAIAQREGCVMELGVAAPAGEVAYVSFRRVGDQERI